MHRLGVGVEFSDSFCVQIDVESEKIKEKI